MCLIISSLYGLSGGDYNLSHLLNLMDQAQKYVFSKVIMLNGTLSHSMTCHFRINEKFWLFSIAARKTALYLAVT